ncbi:carbamoyl-phosphate synthase subunit L [Marinicauda salina]|uniref:Carbamoyl-phosphate synthase subunit L n=1 Tax=Marinicauda salina TaxID=2135793 RepID=A0A2U2BVR4_9PROT|nr:acetyl-CoA carboxylase biotin carboxylase subunit [Marinicauda salina]PWE18115.1 carbamoyl-phosphate synthase subunit L [Marinicauda salina]
MTTRPFDTLLVANRGEIAVRIMRTAKAMGLRTVAVHSDADAGAMHVRAADQTVRIGPAPAAESYLDIDAILAAAMKTGAGAVHPGYGFLSENAAFARAVAEAGLVWIGPPAEAIEAMGDKARAKQKMIDAGVPTVPGWQGEDQSADKLADEAGKIGFPLLIKAAAGGGGRGMRTVRNRDEFADALEAAKREAKSAFGDDAVLLEKLVERGRHVEIQVFADGHGNAIHLGERDCSAQRRRQKVIEEAPSPAVDAALRAKMGADAVAAAKAVGYVGAGTVEFLLDEDGAYYFLEMNTRLQVEHPVTEMVTGLDLVALQLRVAAGEPLPLAQDDVALCGHAIEARLYAEDPLAGFSPQSGPVLYFDPSNDTDGVRIDAGVASGDAITPHYDPMVAKIIAGGTTRDEAIARLISALEAHPLLGVTTNRAFLIDLLDGEAFRSGAVTTADLDRWAEDRSGPFAAEPAGFEPFALGALILAAPGCGALRSGSVTRFDLPLEVDGEAKTLRIEQTGAGAVTVVEAETSSAVRLIGRDGARVRYEIDGAARTAFVAETPDGLHVAFGRRAHQVREPSPWGPDALADPSKIAAPVAGSVVKLDAEVGRAVKAGAVLAVIEAMKMEMRLAAEADGVIAAVHVAKGAQVASGSVLIELELAEQD